MAGELKVSVTRELIEQATKRDSRRCMIAEAIKAARPDYRQVLVDLATIRWTNPRTRKRYIALTPEAAGLALVAFDQEQEIEPFELHLKAVQVTTVAVRERKDSSQLTIDDRGENRYRKQLDRGRKSLTSDGMIQGGKPLPMGHLSNRRISRNDVRVYGRRLLRG